MDTWLKEWKHLVVQVWTDLYLHMDNRTTSRVEGAHNALKKYLQVSTGDLKAVFDRIVILLTTQHIEFDGAVAQQQVKTLHTARHLLYAQLLGRVSNFALGKLWDQRFRLTQPESLPVCTSRFTLSMGLPCAHKIKQRLDEGGVLTLENIHPHWHFNPLPRPVLMPLVLEPAIAQTRGRPSTQERESRRRPLNRAARSRQTASTTRRDPSAFE